MASHRILLLGGTGEGFALAEQLSHRSDYEPISSLAGRTEGPRVPVGAVRRGGFGGVAGLSDYLEREHIAAVIDATHPFAAQISLNAASAAARVGIPIVHIVRQPWHEVDGDLWTIVETMSDAARHCAGVAGKVFLTIGSTELAAFATCRETRFIARTVGPVSPAHDEHWPPQLEFIHAKGPFATQDDLAFMRQRNIQMVVSKNSGGTAAYSKIEAARMLGLPVIMVARPAAPVGTQVRNVAEVLSWLDQTLTSGRDRLMGATS